MLEVQFATTSFFIQFGYFPHFWEILVCCGLQFLAFLLVIAFQWIRLVYYIALYCFPVDDVSSDTIGILCLHYITSYVVIILLH